MAIEYHFRQLNIIVSKGGIYGEQLGVQTVDNIIQQINRYPRDTHLQTVLHHSQDRDLSSGYHYPFQPTGAQKF